MENKNTPLSQQSSVRSPLAGSPRVREAKAPRKTSNFLVGTFVLVITVIGGLAGLYLTQVNQDLRQQADQGDYKVGEPCGENNDCASGNCQTTLGGKYCFPKETCNVATHHIINGNCIPKQCRKNASGIIVCGYVSDADVCTTDSMGGDWCIDDTGTSVECASLGLIRCHCSPGADGGWWVIGKADSCNELCGEAQIDCTDCPPHEPQPTRPPGGPSPTPRPTSTPGPSPTPTTGPSPTPVPSQYPSPTPPVVGPQCHNIQMYDPEVGTSIPLSGDDDAGFEIGDQVNFVCSANTPLSAGYHYEFRIYEPCGSNNHFTPIQVVSESWGINYTIPMLGDYAVQCAVCDESTNTCDWEAYTPTSCQ